jgi:tRNA A37 threonylcarbamoyladenosine dehydratase
LLQGLSLKRVNTFIIGDIGVGKSHLLEQICVSIDHVLRFDDLDNIKRTLGNTLLYLYKNEKQTVYNLIYGDFDLNKAQTRITRESVANLCDEIKKVTVKKEYTIVIDSIDGITPKTVRVLELLKDHFTIIAAARSIKVNHTSLFWDFERIQIKSLSRHHALELIQRLTHDLEVEDYYVLLNHIYEQTNGNPRAIYELVNRYRKEPILTKEVVKSIRHAGALPEYDMTIFIAIILGAIACLRYFTAETGNVSLRTIGGCALILLLLSRYIFPKFKRKYI